MKKCGQRGFTLIEILLCVVILTTGLIVIYRPMLSSLEALNYVYCRLEASDMISEKIWEIQQYAYEKGAMLQRMTRGVTMGRNRVYNYQMNSKSIGQKDNLFEVDYGLTWREGGKRKSLNRVAYVIVPQKI